ncbi:phosphate ABC transporter substrate-binding protein PstS [Calidifontibacter terrae]
MKINHIGRTASVALVASIALAGCGSSSNNDASSSSTGGSTSSSGAAAGASDCFSGSLKAEGSTAQQNAITQAIAAYQAKCSGAKVSYNGTGSGAGITAFTTKQADFAGSDSALKPDKGEPAKAKTACGSDALDLPMVTGPIAVSYNLKGVDKLVLTPDLIAKIFAGKITKWNDPAIAAANKGVTIPAKAITVFFRSDSSGTTDNFTKFMNKTAPTVWTQKNDKAWKGSVGQGKAHSAGVASAVKSTDGGISYVEWSFAVQNQLQMAQLDSGAGAVALSAESAGKGVESAKISGSGNDLSLSLDYKPTTAGAYPLLLVTYEIVCSKYPDATKGKNVKAFLNFMASDEFQSTLTKVGSAPLPKSIQTKVQAAVNSIS